MNLKLLFIPLCAVLALGTVGCATYQSPAPETVAEACWNDLQYAEVNPNTEGLPVYRACLSSKTEYGTPVKVQKKLERKAVKFCAQNGGHYRLLSVGSKPAVRQSQDVNERAARVELAFVCTKDASQATIVNPRVVKANAAATAKAGK